MLYSLAPHTLVNNPAVVSKDFVNLDKLGKEEQEARLVELVEAGDMIGAIRMARQLYSYDLIAAKQFVEELVRKQPTPR
jgi:ribosomal protein L7/L12